MISIETLFQVVLNGLLLGVFYGLISVGFAITYGIMRILNVAHGEILIIGGYVGLVLWQHFNVDPYISIVVAFPFLFLFGILSFYIIGKKFAGKPELALNSLLAGFGLSLILQNTLKEIFGGYFWNLPSSLIPSSINLGFNLVVSGPRIFVGFISTIILFCLYFFLRKTYFGKALTAIVQNNLATLLCGINNEKVSLIGWSLAIAITGLVGPLYGALFSIYPWGGAWPLTKSLVITVFAGLNAPLVYMLVGGIVVGLSESFVALFASPLRDIGCFFIFLLVLILKPRGIGGRE